MQHQRPHPRPPRERKGKGPDAMKRKECESWKAIHVEAGSVGRGGGGGTHGEVAEGGRESLTADLCLAERSHMGHPVKKVEEGRLVDHSGETQGQPYPSVPLDDGRSATSLPTVRERGGQESPSTGDMHDPRSGDVA